MKNIKIIYEYDGSKFFGFQKQPGKKTVQGSIEDAVKKSFNEKINLVSSGRTDRGVHALGQVSNFYIGKNIPDKAIEEILIRKLHKEIRVLKLEEETEKFHARFSAKNRTYLYIMKEKKEISPFESSYKGAVLEKPDIAGLQKILNPFIGRHDFVNFSKKDKENKNTEREILRIECLENGNEEIHVFIEGKSFLKTMIRIMIGSALDVYFGKQKEDYIMKRLDKSEKKDKKILAPAEGLYLHSVNY